MGNKTNSDSSVLMNLNDLFEMETQRRVDEAAEREREKAEAAARAERERREHEEAIRRAREEARAAAQAELDAKNAATAKRIDELRAQLDEVRAAREATRLELIERAATPTRPSNRGSWLAGAMAAMSLVAALTATYVAWPHPQPAMELPAPVVVEVPDAPEVAETPEVIVDEPEAPVELADATPTEAAPEVDRPARPHRPRPQRPQRPAAPDLASQLDFGPGDGLIPE